MIRNGAAQGRRAVVVRDVAIGRVTVRIAQAVVVAGVALIAIRSRTRGTHLVVAGQGPPGGSVAPGGGGEGRRCGMAVGAIAGSESRAGRGVYRVIGGAVIGGVAAVRVVTSAT